MYSKFKPKREMYTVHQLNRLFQKGFIAVINWDEYRIVEFLYPKSEIQILSEGLSEAFASVAVTAEEAAQALMEWFRACSSEGEYSRETKLEKKVRIKTRFFKKKKFVRPGV